MAVAGSGASGAMAGPDAARAADALGVAGTASFRILPVRNHTTVDLAFWMCGFFFVCVCLGGSP